MRRILLLYVSFFLVYRTSLDMAAQFPIYVGLRIAMDAASDLDKLCTLTGESAAAVHRRALDALLRSELPHRLAEAARSPAKSQ